MKNIAIFEQSGYKFGAAESFGLFKCFPRNIHSKKPGLGHLHNILTEPQGRSVRVNVSYLKFLLCSFRKSSRAIVIEGAFGLGALMSSRSPSCSTAQAVVGPKAAIFISPCTKPGKFSFSDLIPEGL